MNRDQRKWLVSVARVASLWEGRTALSPAEAAMARSLSWYARRLSRRCHPSKTDMATLMLMVCRLCRGRSPAELAAGGCPAGMCALLPRSFSGHPYLKHQQVQLFLRR